ncbi:PLC-like phosphodiesterase [Serendipita vermifera]|nr:PLC-like phosphodiesterase [Serendipita vermifera]
MSSVPNDTQLSHLSVPGSHDSAAYNDKEEWLGFRTRQRIEIFSQLNAGIRALDLHYTCHSDTLTLVYSRIAEYPDLGARLKDVIRGLNAWLEIHPSETIFVSLKPDQSCAQDGNAKRLMKKLLDDTADFWVDNPTTGTTLGEARGKLMLLRRFPSDQARGFDLFTGLSANSPYFRLRLDPKRETFAEVEEFFLLREHLRDADQQIDLKLQSIIAHLERAQKARMEELDDLYVTFSGAIGDQSDSHLYADINPKVLALGRGDISGVNANLAEWLRHSPRRPVGIIFMDFATGHRNVPEGEDNHAKDEGDDLIQAIIDMNYPM